MPVDIASLPELKSDVSNGKITADRVGGPVRTLNNGVEMPLFGLGTWQSDKGLVEAAVKTAIGDGYRHLDCAFCYQNEEEVGRGIAAKIADGTVKREDLFVTSKLWNTFHRKEHVEKACRKSLELLGLEYLDLYLIHWPQSLEYRSDEEIFPKNPETGLLVEDPDVDLMETWRAMEELVSKKLVKSIGLSNYNKRQLEYILGSCQIPPAVNQIEVHPYFQQDKLLKLCEDNKILVTAYSPLGSPQRAGSMFTGNDPVVMEDPVLVEIGTKYGKTPQQVAIRWGIQRNHSVIPKSTTDSRIKQNYEAIALSWTLSDEDMAAIKKLDRGLRLCMPLVKNDEGKFVARDGFMKEFPHKETEEF